MNPLYTINLYQQTQYQQFSQTPPLLDLWQSYSQKKKEEKAKSKQTKANLQHKHQNQTKQQIFSQKYPSFKIQKKNQQMQIEKMRNREEKQQERIRNKGKRQVRVDQADCHIQKQKQAQKLRKNQGKIKRKVIKEKTLNSKQQDYQIQEDQQQRLLFQSQDGQEQGQNDQKEELSQQKSEQEKNSQIQKTQNQKKRKKYFLSPQTTSVCISFSSTLEKTNKFSKCVIILFTLLTSMGGIMLFNKYFQIVPVNQKLKLGVKHSEIQKQQGGYLGLSKKQQLGIEEHFQNNLHDLSHPSSATTTLRTLDYKKQPQPLLKPRLQSSMPQNSQDPMSEPNKKMQKNSEEYHSQAAAVVSDKYNFGTPILNILKEYSLDTVNPKDLGNLMGIERTKYGNKLAIQKVQLNHNVKYKGKLKLKVQKTDFQKTGEDIQLKKERLTKLLQEQKDYYEYYYEMSKYQPHQHRFCVVVASYNNVKSRLYLRNMDSIFQQDYDNYHVVYIDDASPDKTGVAVKQYMDQHPQIPQEKIKIIINEKNVLALKNIHDAITLHCNLGEIVMLVDGDDSLLGTQVMSVFNAAYHRQRAGLVYSKYLKISNNKAMGQGESSRKIPEKSLKTSTFRKLRGFYTSHLITFYVDLYRKIDVSYLTYSNGTFFDFSYDVAIVTPIIEMLGMRVYFLPELTYEYRFDTGMNDPVQGQKQVTKLIYDKQAYQKLQQSELQFIDNWYDDIQYVQRRKKKKQIRKEKRH